MNLLSIFFCIWWIITNDIACLGCLYLVGLFFYCSRNKNSRLVLLLPKHIYEGSSDRRISNVYFFSGVGSVEKKKKCYIEINLHFLRILFAFFINIHKILFIRSCRYILKLLFYLFQFLKKIRTCTELFKTFFLQRGQV